MSPAANSSLLARKHMLTTSATAWVFLLGGNTAIDFPDGWRLRLLRPPTLQVKLCSLLYSSQLFSCARPEVDYKNRLLTLGGSNHELTEILVVFTERVYLLVISIFLHFLLCLWVFFLSQKYLNLGRRCPTNYVNSFLSRLASNALVSHSCCKSHYGAFPCKN